MASSITYLLFLLFTLACKQIVAQTYTGPEDSRVNTEIVYPNPINGVSTTPDGRLFLVIARVDGSTGPQVVEYDRESNTSTAYPNEEWNSYAEGKDPATHFLGVNAQRVGPDGNLWIVDKGATALGGAVDLPDGPKVVVVNTDTDEVSRVYNMGSAVRVDSLLDDIRFSANPQYAYLTVSPQN